MRYQRSIQWNVRRLDVYSSPDLPVLQYPEDGKRYPETVFVPCVVEPKDARWDAYAQDAMRLFLKKLVNAWAQRTQAEQPPSQATWPGA
jgi:hypothetical protein